MSSPAMTLEITRGGDPLMAMPLDGPVAYRVRTERGQWAELPFQGSPALVAALKTWTAGKETPTLQDVFFLALSERLPLRIGEGRPALTLRLGAMELHQLPWELLPVRSGLSLGHATHLRVCWPETRSAAWVQGPTEASRVLCAWSASGGPVPNRQHLAAWNGAWSSAGLGAVDALPEASLAAIRMALQRAADESRCYTALHLLCHGIGLAGGVGLALDDLAGPVSGEALAATLAPFAGSLRLVVLAACRGGDAGGGAMGSVAAAVHRAGISAVIACRRPFAIPASNAFVDALGRALAQPSAVDQALEQARSAMGDWPRDAEALTLLARPEDGEALWPIDLCPYPGLRPYTPERARFFFGREREIRSALAAYSLLEAEGRPRLLLVVGPSGVGKSSVAEAGVGRALANSTPPWRTLTLRPGATPLENLARGLGQAPPTEPLLLVVDQLEELFTHAPAAERDPFLARIWALATGDAPVRVLMTLRADLTGLGAQTRFGPGLPRLDELAEGTGAWSTHRLAVVGLDRAALADAVVLPAKATGLVLAPGLAGLLLDETAGEPGALPLLAHALAGLWAQRKGRLLSLEAHRAMGGVAGSLRQEADAVWQGLDPAAQRASRRLLVSLVDAGSARAGGLLDARRSVPKEELLPNDPEQRAAFERALAAWTGHRLLLEGADGTVEVAHEALLRAWAPIRAWVSEDRALLSQVADVEAWTAEAERDHSALDGPRLALAARLAAEAKDRLSTRALARIHADLRASRRQRLQGRAAAVGIALLALGATGALVASGFARQRASQATARATDAALLGALPEYRYDPQRQARLLLAVSDPALPGWQEAAAALSGLELLLSPDGFARPVAWEPGTGRVLLRSSDGLVIVDPQDRQEDVVLAGSESQTAFDLRVVWGDAGIFAFDPLQGALRRWSPTGQRLAPVEGEIAALAESEENGAVAAARQKPDSVLIWRAGSDSPSAVAAAAPTALAWAGDTLAIGRFDGGVTLDSGEVLLAGGPPVSALAWSPDRSTLGVGDRGGGMRLLDATSGAVRASAPLGAGVSALAWSPERGLAAAGAGGAVLLLRPDGTAEPLVPRRPIGVDGIDEAGMSALRSLESAWADSALDKAEMTGLDALLDAWTPAETDEALVEAHQGARSWRRSATVQLLEGGTLPPSRIVHLDSFFARALWGEYAPPMLAWEGQNLRWTDGSGKDWVLVAPEEPGSPWTQEKVKSPHGLAPGDRTWSADNDEGLWLWPAGAAAEQVSLEDLLVEPDDTGGAEHDNSDTATPEQAPTGATRGLHAVGLAPDGAGLVALVSEAEGLALQAISTDGARSTLWTTPRPLPPAKDTDPTPVDLRGDRVAWVDDEGALWTGTARAGAAPQRVDLGWVDGPLLAQDEAGQRLAVSQYGLLRIWDLRSSPPRLDLATDTGCAAMAFDKNNHLACATSFDGIFILDLRTGETDQRLPGDADTMTWAPDGRALAVHRDRDLLIHRVDGEGRFEAGVVVVDVEYNSPLAWTPDSAALAAVRARRDNVDLVMLDGRTGKEAPPRALPCMPDLGLAWATGTDHRLLVAGRRCVEVLDLDALAPRSGADSDDPQAPSIPLHGLDACLGPVMRTQILGESPDQAWDHFADCAKDQGVDPGSPQHFELSPAAGTPPAPTASASAPAGSDPR